LRDKRVRGELLIEKLYMLNSFVRPYLEDLGLIDKNNIPHVLVPDEEEA